MNFVHDSTEAIEGVLFATRGPWLTFRDVSALRAGQPPTKIVGDVVMHRDRVAFMQVAP